MNEYWVYYFFNCTKIYTYAIYLFPLFPLSSTFIKIKTQKKFYHQDIQI